MNRTNRLTKTLDLISLWTGKATAWLIIPMAAVLVWEVVIRYIYKPTIWAVDMAMIMYGTHFFVTGAMTLYLGKHIRTDFFYQKWSVRVQAWMDLVCYILLFIPGMAMFVWLSWEFFQESWILKEQLMTTWRPPAYPYKFVIPLSGTLLFLQGISEFIKCIQTIKTGVDHRNQGAEKSQEIPAHELT